MTSKQPSTKPAVVKQNILRAGKGDAAQNYVLAIHGGAGTMNRDNSTPEKRAKYRAALTRALEAGYQVLKLGGEAMDAAVAAVTVMEGEWVGCAGLLNDAVSYAGRKDCPLFNAGKGAVFNAAGKVRHRFIVAGTSLTLKSTSERARSVSHALQASLRTPRHASHSPRHVRHPPHADQEPIPPRPCTLPSTRSHTAPDALWYDCRSYRRRALGHSGR